jgi:hypothetical protein
MSLSPDTQRDLLAKLHSLAFERETAEGQTRAEFEAASERAKRELSDARQAAIGKFQLDRDNTQREYDAVVAGATMQFDTLRSEAESDLQRAVEKARADCVKAERRAKKKLAEEIWEANTVYEATQNAPKLQLDQEEKQIEALTAALNQALIHANRRLADYRHAKMQRHLPAEIVGESPAIEGALLKLHESVQQARAQLQELNRPLVPKLLAGGAPWGLVLLLAAVFCGLSY